MGGVLREQDRFLPIANVARIMKKAIPSTVSFCNERPLYLYCNNTEVSLSGRIDPGYNNETPCTTFFDHYVFLKDIMG